MQPIELITTGAAALAVKVAGERIATALIHSDARAASGAGQGHGGARLAIPGGSAVEALAHAIPALPPGVWARTRLTWVDERCVPLADAESNRGAARRKGLLPPPEHGPGFELPLWLDGETAAAAKARVERDLAGELGGALDVVLLGMGEDGHVASLFPGHPALAARGPVAHVPDSPKPPPARMTLTLPLLASAGAIVLLATGAGKRAALERVLRRDPALPASQLDHLVVVTDLDLEISS